jgi:hypothetical protein
MQYGFNAKTQRGQPQPNTRFEQEATEETERWTMSSDALFSLLSPVQSILFQRSNSTTWHGTPQPKPCRKGQVRAEAQGAEKESLADLLSRCCSALSAFSARKKSSRPCVMLTDCSAASAEKKFCQKCRLLRHCSAESQGQQANLGPWPTLTISWWVGLPRTNSSLRLRILAPLR